MGVKRATVHVSRVTVHCVDIEDKPGSLHRFLSQCSLSGVNFLCFIAVSCGDNRGKIYVSAKNPKTFASFAQEAKIKVAQTTGFIIDDADRVGAAADVIAALAKNDIPGLAGAAMVVGGRYQMLIIVDAKNADRAQKVL